MTSGGAGRRCIRFLRARSAARRCAAAAPPHLPSPLRHRHSVPDGTAAHGGGENRRRGGSREPRRGGRRRRDRVARGRHGTGRAGRRRRRFPQPRFCFPFRGAASARVYFLFIYSFPRGWERGEGRAAAGGRAGGRRGERRGSPVTGRRRRSRRSLASPRPAQPCPSAQPLRRPWPPEAPAAGRPPS